MKKRILSLLCLLALLLSLSATALAATPEEAEPHATHSHPICGSSCRCDDATHSSTTWTAWNGTSSTYAGRSYYLTQDVTRENDYIFNGTGTIRICLNGHTIKTNGWGVGFEVGENFTLILCDCKGGGGIIADDEDYSSSGSGEYALFNGGRLTVYGGEYTAGYCSVYNESTGVFRMVGGTLSGGEYAVDNSGEATLSGGQISTFGSYGTAVNNWDGTLTISGGTYSGYDVLSNYYGDLTVTGGTFTGTSRTVENYGTAYIRGGTFSSTHATSGYTIFNGGTLHLSGGTLTAKGENGFCLYNYGSSARAYLSGSPSLSSIFVTHPDTLYAANQLQTIPYQGGRVSLDLSTYYFSGGDAAVCAVTDSTAPLFTIPADADYTLVREGSELVVYQPVASGQCGAQGDNLLWSLDNGGTLTISGTGDMADYTHQEGSSPPPWTKYRSQIKQVIVEEGVTSIGDDAFNYFTEITSVKLPSTMTYLGDSAFYDAHKLSSINLPDRISYIGPYCFQYCYVLAIDQLPTGVKVYQPYSFRNVGANLSSLPPLVIPEGVTEIGDGAFAEWYKLTSITLPSTLTTIGDQAFYKNRVTSVHIPAAVRTIGSDAFGWESYDSLTYIYFCGDAPDASNSWGRPFRSYGAIKLFHRETAQGFDAPDYAAYDKSVWDDEEHCTLRGRYVSPTCIEGGYTEYTCSLCDWVRKAYDGSAPLPHTPKAFPGKDPTCFEDGYTAGTRCSVCDTLTSGGNPIPAAHSFGDWAVRTTPTLLLPGEEVRCCSACPEEQTRSTPATGPAVANSITASWDEETRTLTLSGIPAEVTVVVGFYDGGRFVYGDLAMGSGEFTLPKEVSFTNLTLFFLTDGWQPISLQREVL